MSTEENYYCKNLAEVNKSHQVVTNQAIYNDQGVLLLAHEADLNEKRVAILLQHKLMKPIEQCVGISNSFNAKQLNEYLNKFSNNIPGLKAITTNDEYQKVLIEMCIFYEKFPLLKQNLAVLALRLPEIYFQGLFSALAGLAIAIQLKLEPKELHTIFISGLFHDVGFLYLAPELSRKNQEFSSDEWKALQTHPIIAQRFLSLEPNLPKEIAIAISHHHERIDGTGYPHHVFGDRLSIASQIIATTDNIILNHARYQNYGVHAHAMLLTALKLSDNIYFESVYAAAVTLFKLVSEPLTELPPIPSPSDLLVRQKMLQLKFEHAKSLAKKLMAYSPGAQTRSLSAAMGRLAISVVRSGILQPEQEEWLCGLVNGNASDDGLSLVEMSVMLDQIYDQLLHLKNILTQVVATIPNKDFSLKALAEKALIQLDLHEAPLS